MTDRQIQDNGLLQSLRDHARNIRLHYGVSDWANRMEEAAGKIELQQAKIDALMLEYCPDEMTAEQKANWAEHQRLGLRR